VRLSYFYLFEFRKLGLYLTFFEHLGLGYELVQLEYLVLKRSGVNGCHYCFKCVHYLLLFVLGEFIEIFRKLVSYPLLPIAFRVVENFLAFIAHTLQTSSGRIDARSKSSLEHCHGERKRPSSRRIVLLCLDGLFFNVSGQCVIEFPLIIIYLELYCLHVTVGKYLITYPSIRVRECYEGLFGPS